MVSSSRSAWVCHWQIGSIIVRNAFKIIVAGKVRNQSQIRPVPSFYRLSQSMADHRFTPANQTPVTYRYGRRDIQLTPSDPITETDFSAKPISSRSTPGFVDHPTTRFTFTAAKMPGTAPLLLATVRPLHKESLGIFAS